MKVILDCNIWISFLLGYQTSAMQYLLCHPDIDIYVCDEILQEIRSVGIRHKIATRIAEDDLDNILNVIAQFCTYNQITTVSNVSIRDSKDIYLLSFAESIQADYLVSGDKDLLVLKHHEETKIVSLSEFKSFLEFV